MQRHIKDRHLEKLSCELCSFKVPKGRQARLERHMLQKHNFPVPPAFMRQTTTAVTPVKEEERFDVDNICLTPMPSPDPAHVPDLSHLFPVEEPDVSGIPLIPIPDSPKAISRSSTPLLDELPLSPFPATAGNIPSPGAPEAEVSIPWSPAPLTESELKLTIPAASTLPSQTPAEDPAIPEPETSTPEVLAAVASILPDLESEAPFDPLPDQPVSAPLDIFAEACRQIPPEILEAHPAPADYEPVPVDPNDPRYFFHGAPSEFEDDSSNARLIREARDRALNSWYGNYRVEFSAMNIFCVQKKEMVTLPDGTEYSLTTYWCEEPTPISEVN